MGEQAVLVRFGEIAHLVQLRDEGLLYMNPVSYFWGIEDSELRGDPCDSIEEIRRGARGVVVKDGTTQEVPVRNWVLRIHPPDPENINVFCMYALRPSAGTFPVDPRNIRFGDHALVIIDVNEFIRRIEAHFKTANVRGSANLVQYVDDDYVGELGPLKKRKAFSYQSEWRVVCYDGPGAPRQLRIGSISDISRLIESKCINDEIQVSF